MHICMYNIDVYVSTYKCDVHVHVITCMYTCLKINLLVSPLNALHHLRKAGANNLYACVCSCVWGRICSLYTVAREVGNI